ncbi:MAG TPA: HAMP domain-containing protein, partial [Actinomycetota bacterium]|nr:HAMP domain-containing protein [Actinomycetota bacterium]
MLFTSAIVVGALLLLGAALHALLAKSLYTQQSNDAVLQVKQLIRQNELGNDVTGLDTKQVQAELRERLTSGQSGQPSFDALVLRGRDGTETPSSENFRFRHVPPELAERVARRDELAYVPIRSPVGPGRMLVVGAPIRIDQSDVGAQQVYFFYPLNFQEETLAKLTNFLLIVGAGLLAAVVILAAISIGRVLKPIQRARDVAEEIAAGNLAARIPQATSQDDFGKLA